MLAMIELFLWAVVLGLLFNAMPGAIFAESLRRGLGGGFLPALSVQIGSLAGDLVWAVLGLMGAAALFSLPLVEKPLALFGAVLLGHAAWQAFRDALAPRPEFIPAMAMDASALATGAALSLSNPMNITWWAGLGGTVTTLGAADPGWSAFGVFLAGFMLSSVAWCFLCAGAISWTRSRLGGSVWKLLNMACAAGLAGCAGLIVRRVIGI